MKLWKLEQEGAGEKAAEKAAEGIEDAGEAVGLVTAKLNEWFEGLIELLPNLIVAILVVLVFFLVSSLVRRLLRKTLIRMSVAPSLASFVSRIAGFAVSAVGLFFALGLLHLDKTVTSLLAGAGVLGLAVAFAFQDLAANFMAGIYMSVKQPFSLGQLIETNDVFGTVERIDMRSMVLRTTQGQTVRIPNKKVFEERLTNFSESGERRVDLEVGVSYGEDLERVRKVALEAVSQVKERNENKDVEVFFTGFGGSSIDLVIRFWIQFGRQIEYLAARDSAIVAVKQSFDASSISIPFPIRTLDFGIKGGAALREEVEAWAPSSDGDRD